VVHRWVRVSLDYRKLGLTLTRSFRQYEIMDMQCDLLISDFRDPTTITLVQENIGRISHGSSSHHASALKLGFKKALEFKKREGRALLRCFNSSCRWHSNPVSYSSVGSNIYCTRCSNYRYYMQCTGCGNQRTSNNPSCWSCGKEFM